MGFNVLVTSNANLISLGINEDGEHFADLRDRYAETPNDQPLRTVDLTPEQYERLLYPFGRADAYVLFLDLFDLPDDTGFGDPEYVSDGQYELHVEILR